MFKENIKADNHNLRVSADKSIDPFPRIPDKSGPHALVYNAILKELIYCIKLKECLISEFFLPAKKLLAEKSSWVTSIPNHFGGLNDFICF